MASEKDSSITAAEAREQFSDVINRAAYGRERIVVTRRGKPVAAMVPPEDLALLEEIEAREQRSAGRQLSKGAVRKEPAPKESVREGATTLDEILKEFGVEG